jgi:hypothetical protein
MEDLQGSVNVESSDVQMEEPPIPTVTEVASSTDFSEYNKEENSYFFRGMKPLVEIINRHDGNVEIFLLPNSSIQTLLYWVGQVRNIKKMAIYVPAQMFPVRPTPPSICQTCRAHGVDLCEGLCELCESLKV